MSSKPSILAQVKAARRVSVPLVAISTPDPAATIQAIADGINGGAAIVVWDVVSGMRPRNDAAKPIVADASGEQDPTIGNPLALTTVCLRFPEKTIVFMHLANRWLIDPSLVQGIWNLRDAFKSDRRMLILLGPAIDLPAELAGDVVVFDEPLPDPEHLAAIVTEQHQNADLKIKPAEMGLAVEAVQGLPAFQAEQVVAMSLGKEGLDIGALWERKHRQIELTPGLKVQREPVKFGDVGGVSVIKSFLGRILAGQSRPNAIVFIDEIEKFLAGSGGGGDTSGVSQDQLGTLLAYMQDHNAAGCIFVGPPGSGKSVIAKATGNEAGIPTIQLDLGGMKGSLVGQSEQSLRAALKVITSVSNERSLWIATCNAISELPPELRRRFTLGTFFFDLPDSTERASIWKLYNKRFFDGKANKYPPDEGWTGAEIRQCCEIAWRLGCTLTEAAGYIVPVSRSAADQLERLRRGADNRFLCASQPGVYRHPANREQPTQPARRRLGEE